MKCENAERNSFLVSNFGSEKHDSLKKKQFVSFSGKPMWKLIQQKTSPFYLGFDKEKMLLSRHSREPVMFFT
jgi:hypothetical protein